MSRISYLSYRILFSRRLSQALTGSGKTPSQLARYLGISRASVCSWLHANSLPALPLLPKIADFTASSLDDLLRF